MMKRTKLVNMVDALCLLLMMVSTVYLLAHWSALPDRVPIHYGLSGKANGWIGREHAWLLPCIIWGLFALFSVIECFPCLWGTGGIKITDENRDCIYAIMRNMLCTTKMLALALLSVLVVDAAHGGGAVPSGLISAFLPLIAANIVFWWVKMFLNRRPLSCRVCGKGSAEVHHPPEADRCIRET